ncbi:MAG TPA: PHP domain-containing protein, partial [Roseiflexaceae bacterium]|nr:PHP domain-containing protein [Roseiflexaceae bacterium]
MIDLHIHTTATPHHASWKPQALVAAAQARGLHAIAATDHNTMASVAALQAAAAAAGLAIVSGVEIDSGFIAAPGRPLRLWHTLVYGAEPQHPVLLELCAAVFERNQADAVRLQHELIARGFRLAGLDTLGRPPNVADVGTALGRLNELPGREAGDDDEAAGMRYILTQISDGYRPVGVAEVISAAHSAGGVAVLAHPGRSKGIYAVPADATDITAMVAAGLDGTEVFYPSHTHAQRVELLGYARR